MYMLRYFTAVLIVLAVSSRAEAYSPFNYFTDTAPPEISTSIMNGGSYGGKINVVFVITDESTSIRNVKVFLNDTDITGQVRFASHKRKNRLEINTEELKDGKHYLVITATDSSMTKNRTIEEIMFNVDNTPPLLKLTSGAGVFKQGKTAILYFNASEPDLDIKGMFQGKDFKIYPYGKRYRAVIGFSIDDPGNDNYFMKVTAVDKAGNPSEYHYKVYVGKTKFETLSFALKPKKMQLLMPETIREDWKKIEDIVVEENDVKYFGGKFIRPAAGRISMAFGLNQNINGDESGKHRGLDYANAVGTPVIASNAGLVRLAERLPAHGNTVVIEHGQGIFTYYAHLSSIVVTPGQMVEKGQKIGLIGSTGVATGPHLHFSVSLHNLRVDPQQWLEGVVVD